MLGDSRSGCDLHSKYLSQPPSPVYRYQVDAFYNTGIPSSLRPIFKELVVERASNNYRKIGAVNKYFCFPAEINVFGTCNGHYSEVENILFQFEYYKTPSNRVAQSLQYNKEADWWFSSLGVKEKYNSKGYDFSGYSTYLDGYKSNMANSNGLIFYGCI